MIIKMRIHISFSHHYTFQLPPFSLSLGVVLHMGQGGHGHSHGGLGGHGHSHGRRPSRAQGNEQQSSNINVRAAFIHVLGDLIQSIGVLIAAYVIRYYVSIRITVFCNYLIIYFL